MSPQDSAVLFLETIPRSMRLIRAEVRRIAGAEFTIPQYRVLARIFREPGSNAQLAEWMGVRPATMSQMLDTLVRRGLVRRSDGPANSDRRRNLIILTGKGRISAQRIRRAAARVFAARISELPADVRREVVQGLRALKEHLT